MESLEIFPRKPSVEKIGCCNIESIVSVDERGQMVIPKELRDKAKIKAGEKLVIMTWEKDGEVCCITLIKAENLAQMAKNLIGPVIGEIISK